MDYKFNVTCKRCGCGTELRSGKWETDGIFRCPNCKAQMTDDLFEALKYSSTYIAILAAGSDGFSFSVNISQEDN